MLVLARGVGQKIEICGDLIEVTVLSVTGSIVRLGFDAPREISIVRKEVADERRAAELEGEEDALGNG